LSYIKNFEFLEFEKIKGLMTFGFDVLHFKIGNLHVIMRS